MPLVAQNAPAVMTTTGTDDTVVVVTEDLHHHISNGPFQDQIPHLNLNDPLLHYTYNSINSLIRTNSFDANSEATTPVSSNWTPPPFSTPPQWDQEQLQSQLLGKRKSPEDDQNDIVHCQPVKRKSFSVSTPSSRRSQLRFIYPQLSPNKLTAISNAAKTQHLNIASVSSILALLKITNLHSKLQLLSFIFNDFHNNNNNNNNNNIVFNNSSQSGNFIDPSQDDTIIISELTNLKAHSILIPTDGNFLTNKLSPLSKIKPLPFMHGYFRPINPLAYHSSYFLYRETFIRVFTLLSFINSITPYLKYKFGTSFSSPNNEARLLNSIIENLSREDIVEMKLNLSLKELDFYLVDRIISIMWLNEDPIIKRAFEL